MWLLWLGSPIRSLDHRPRELLLWHLSTPFRIRVRFMLVTCIRQSLVRIILASFFCSYTSYGFRLMATWEELECIVIRQLMLFMNRPKICSRDVYQLRYGGDGNYKRYNIALYTYPIESQTWARDICWRCDQLWNHRSREERIQI